MENYQKAQEYAQASAESGGSAMERYQVYTESLEAAVTRLKNSWQAFSATLVDSNLAIGVIDFLTDFVNLLDGIVDKVGVLQTLIGGFAIGKGLTSFYKGFD